MNSGRAFNYWFNPVVCCSAGSRQRHYSFYDKTTRLMCSLKQEI